MLTLVYALDLCPCMHALAKRTALACSLQRLQARLVMPKVLRHAVWGVLASHVAWGQGSLQISPAAFAVHVALSGAAPSSTRQFSLLSNLLGRPQSPEYVCFIDPRLVLNADTGSKVGWSLAARAVLVLAGSVTYSVNTLIPFMVPLFSRPPPSKTVYASSCLVTSYQGWRRWGQLVCWGTGGALVLGTTSLEALMLTTSHGGKALPTCCASPHWSGR
jgi:hypothetical protein